MVFMMCHLKIYLWPIRTITTEVILTEGFKSVLAGNHPLNGKGIRNTTFNANVCQNSVKFLFFAKWANPGLFFVYFRSFLKKKQYNFYNKSMLKMSIQMSIQYLMPGFEPTSSQTWVITYTRGPARNISVVNGCVLPWCELEYIFLQNMWFNLQFKRLTLP